MIGSRHNISVHLGNKEQAQQYLNIRTTILKESDIENEFIEKSIKSIEQNLLNDHYSFFLVKNSGKVMGYVQLVCGELPYDQHIGHIKMDTLQTYRVNEIHRKMLVYVEGHAISENLKRLELIIPQSSFNMVNINVSLGYRIEGKLTHFFRSEGSYRDAYLMAKILG